MVWILSPTCKRNCCHDQNSSYTSYVNKQSKMETGKLQTVQTCIKLLFLNLQLFSLECLNTHDQYLLASLISFCGFSGFSTDFLHCFSYPFTETECLSYLFHTFGWLRLGLYDANKLTIISLVSAVVWKMASKLLRKTTWVLHRQVGIQVCRVERTPILGKQI